MQIGSSSTTQASGSTNGSVVTPTPKPVNQDAPKQPSEAPKTESPANGFHDFMLKALGGTSRPEVSEEELFAALLEQKLAAASPDAGTFYAAEKAKLMVSMARPDGYVPVEDVASAALKATVAAGKIDRAAAEKINGEAFAGAQLDGNMDALFDNRGGENDPTVAVMKMEEALSKVEAALAKIESGELSASPRDLDTPSNKAPTPGGTGGGPPSSGDIGSAPEGSQKLDGSGGFLWKPVSESNGNLVVLLPSSLNDLVDRVEIHSALPPSDGTKIGEGRFSSIANGDRSHWRFSKPGAEYGDGIHVVAFRKDGQTVTWQIDDGSERTD